MSLTAQPPPPLVTDPSTLPSELLAMVATSLNLEDVLACVQVSRGWHAAWTQHNVAVTLRRVFFPGLPGRPTFAAFREACHRYLRRRDGQFTSVSHHGPPRPDNLDDMTVVSMDRAERLCYGDGIILWGAFSYLLLDDLRTRKCTAICLQDWGFVPHVSRENIRVNETLIVCQDFFGSDGSFYVYNHHASRGTTVQLPEDPLDIAVHKDQVLFVLPSLRVYSITYDGTEATILSFETRPTFIREWPLFAPLFSEVSIFVAPHDTQRHFVLLRGSVPVFCGDRDDQSPLFRGDHILVGEFRDSHPVAIYDYELWKVKVAGLSAAFGPTSDQVRRRLRHTISSVSAAPCDENGLFSVAHLIPEQGRETDAGLPGPLLRNNYYQLRVTFDTVTRRFGIQRYLLQDNWAGIRYFNTCLWNGQLFSPFPEHDGELEMQVHDPHPSSPGDAKSGLVATWSGGKTMLPQEARDKLAEYSAGDLADICGIRCDKDFMIFFAGRANYSVVWDFGELDRDQCGESSTRDKVSDDAVTVVN